jgi:hypothetical protein
VATGSYPRYTAAELEQIAADTVNAYFPLGVTIPIDIDYLVESDPRVTLDVMRGLKDTYAVAGAVVTHPDEARVTILIDEAVADGPAPFYRFTLAEEFGHLVLHRPVIERIANLEEVVALHRSSEYYDVLDRNAKRFAAAILMPAAQLRKDAQAVFIRLRAGRLDITTLVTKLTVQLARQYSVSTTAMRHRLGEWPVSVIDAIQQAFARGLPTLP